MVSSKYHWQWRWFVQKFMFLTIYVNTDKSLYKHNPFYFSNMILFCERFFISNTWFKSHFGYITAVFFSEFKAPLARRNGFKKVTPIYGWLFEFSFSSWRILELKTFYLITEYHFDSFSLVGLRWNTPISYSHSCGSLRNQ